MFQLGKLLLTELRMTLDPELVLLLRHNAYALGMAGYLPASASLTVRPSADVDIEGAAGEETAHPPADVDIEAALGEDGVSDDDSDDDGDVVCAHASVEEGSDSD